MLSLSLGIVLLTGAVFANYENASGYSVLKDALKKIAYEENYTAEYETGLFIDGEELEKSTGTYWLNVGGNPSSRSDSVHKSRSGRTYKNFYAMQDGVRIHQYLNENDNDNSGGYINNSYRDDYSIILDVTGGDADMAEKLIGFTETIADTMIGDLKNSFVMTDENNETKTYSINLSKEQMPSYVTSGVALVTSLLRRDTNYDIDTDDDDPTVNFIGSGEPYISNVSGAMTIDENGNPIYANIEIEIIGFDRGGDEHSLKIAYAIKVRDIGTTEIDRIPDEVLSTFENYADPEWRKVITEGEAASIGIIGGADGPTAVYVAP